MKKLFLAAACTLAAAAHAQQHETVKMYDLSKKIFIEPVALIDFANASSIRAGIEWPVLKNFCSIFAMTGQYVDIGLEPRPYYGQYNRLGFRLYPSTGFTTTSSERFYLSLHVFYKTQKFAASDNLRDVYGEAGAVVKYNVSKDSKGAHIEIGRQVARKHLCFETYFGLGIRQSTVTNSIGDSALNQLYHIREGFINGIGNTDKTNAIRPSVTLGIRLSYLFKTKFPASPGDKTYSVQRRLQKIFGQ